MPKRASNEGTIRKRPDGRWEARYLASGKRRSIYAHSQEEAKKKLREALHSLDKGEYVEPSRMTVAVWLDTWYQAYGKPKWRESTAAIHADNIRLHLKPALGKILLQKLRTDQIQSFISKQIEKGLSSASIRKQMEPLKSALKQAVDNQLLLRNPADKVSLPAANQTEIECLTPNEQKALIPLLVGSTSKRALLFILKTGLRASELCGLRWADIETDSFTVKQGVQRVRINGETKIFIAPPKTKAGWRTIPLSPITLAILEEQKREQRKQRLTVGEVWQGGIPGQGETYVFSSDVGTPLDRTNLGRVLRKTLDDSGLKHRGIHALRHTFATNYVRASKDYRALSEILGHTKVAFTIQLYVHSDIDTKRDTLTAIENSF